MGSPPAEETFWVGCAARSPVPEAEPRGSCVNAFSQLSPKVRDILKPCTGKPGLRPWGVVVRSMGTESNLELLGQPPGVCLNSLNLWGIARIKFKLFHWDFLCVDVERSDANHERVGSGNKSRDAIRARLEVMMTAGRQSLQHQSS